MSANQIISLELDGIEHTTPFLQDERERAIHGLLEFNHFNYLKAPDLSYKVQLSIEDGYLVFRFRDEADNELPLLAVSPRPYKKLIQDYFTMVESYEQMRAHSPYKLEAVDMARRSIHNEAAELLKDRLAEKIDMDFETARRLFTLICALHLSGRRMIVG